tara:strand:- start:15 stop:719 length:705 start_codon:yes stop_codon:yes gene_type:complete
MAVSIDNVYQKVQALSNKEQKGYITPQEFNLLADKAQNEIFNNYFHKIKLTENKIKTQTLHSDELEILEEKLHPFFNDTTVSTSTADLALPTNLHKIISITRGGNQVTQLNKSEVAYTENNPLTRATTTRSTFVREDSGTVTIFPAPTVSTSFEINFYAVPTTPNWAYVLTGASIGYQTPMYDQTNATDFQLHASEEENLVDKILVLAGVTIQRPDLQQAGTTQMQLTQQQQNS